MNNSSAEVWDVLASLKFLGERALIADDRSVLELGCGLPLTLYALHHRLGFIGCTGLDRAPEPDLPIDQGGRPVQSSYEKYVVLARERLAVEPISQAAFPHVFNLKWNQDLTAYMDTERFVTRYDLVVLSGLLQWSKPDITFSMVKKAEQLVNPGGLLYLRADKTAGPFNQSVAPARPEYSAKRFDDIKEDFKRVIWANDGERYYEVIAHLA